MVEDCGWIGCSRFTHIKIVGSEMLGFFWMNEGTQIAFIGVIVTALIAPTWLAWWNSRIARKEFQPNGGSSLADKITRIESKVSLAGELSKQNHERISIMNRRQGEMDHKLDDHIKFMAEAHNRTNKKERSTDVETS